jgi:hypothetical protein
LDTFKVESLLKNSSPSIWSLGLVLLCLAFPSSRAVAGSRNQCTVVMTAAIMGIWLALPVGTEVVSWQESQRLKNSRSSGDLVETPLSHALLSRVERAELESDYLKVSPEKGVSVLTVLDGSWGAWAASAIKTCLEQRQPEVADLPGWRDAGVPVPVEKVLLRTNPKRPTELFVGVSGVYWTAWSDQSIHPARLFWPEAALPMVFKYRETTDAGAVQVTVHGQMVPRGNGKIEFHSGQGVLRAVSPWGMVAEDAFELPAIHADFFSN